MTVACGQSAAVREKLGINVVQLETEEVVFSFLDARNPTLPRGKSHRRDTKKAKGYCQGHFRVSVTFTVLQPSQYDIFIRLSHPRLFPLTGARPLC